MKKSIRLGTRGSPLALVQAEEVRRKLLETHPHLHAEGGVELVSIRTSGDWQGGGPEKSLAQLGGDKGLFTKEIEEALLADYIDIAVHSLKDMPSRLPPGLTIAAVLERVDPRDAFISPKARTIAELPNGAHVGTASLRRQAQLLHQRPDLRITPLRGNVETRLKKLAAGEMDATLLAVAGLSRLDISNRITSILDAGQMLPAAGQGALALESRADNAEMRAFAAALTHQPSLQCVSAERAFLEILDGSCHTPIAALATIDDAGHLALAALAAKPDGSSLIRLNKIGSPSDAASLGRTLGEEMKSRLPADFFAA